ncbi:ATP-binding cassette domain-containing protein [Streptomyces xinghaiensis]|uniref:ATP-binding cassette domain-containing protein n=1 Tax=Streptomyces xinghaiensis TaxID=1038928 RepID=UPI00343AECB4
MKDTTPRGAAVSAGGFGLRGPRGWAFRDIAVTAEPGALIAVEGPSGTGRTCLLLALTGRMRAHTGHAEVGGLRLPTGRGARRGHMAAVRRISALGPVPGVSELEPSLTVAEHLRERALMERRFGTPPRELLRPRAARATDLRERIEAALEGAGLAPETLPKGSRTTVRDLERLESLRLSVALALTGRPRLLAVDDADLKLHGRERAAVWELLAGVAAAGTTVLAVCSQAPPGSVTVRTAAAETPGDDGTSAGPSGARTDSTDGTTDGTTDGKGAPDAFATTRRA